VTLAALSADYDMLRCPFCGGSRVRVDERQRGYEVRCLNLECRARGPWKHDHDEAMDAWNNRTAFRRDCGK
jgi:Lar family restriction alleviation protein